MRERVLFKFPDVNGVEDDVALAIFSAECVHGRPQTRLEVTYQLGLDLRSCVVEVAGPAGEMSVRVLIGLLAARFGESGFEVNRIGAGAAG